MQFQDASGGQQFDHLQNLVDLGHYRQVKGRIQVARGLHTDLPFAAHQLKGSARGSRGFSVYPNGSLWGQGGHGNRGPVRRQSHREGLLCASTGHFQDLLTGLVACQCQGDLGRARFQVQIFQGGLANNGSGNRHRCPGGLTGQRYPPGQNTGRDPHLLAVRVGDRDDLLPVTITGNSDRHRVFPGPNQVALAQGYAQALNGDGCLAHSVHLYFQ